MYNRSMDSEMRNLFQDIKPNQGKNNYMISNKSPIKSTNNKNINKSTLPNQRYDITSYMNNKPKKRVQLHPPSHIKKGQFTYRKRIYEDEMKESQQRIVNPDNISIISQDYKVNYFDGDSIDLGRGNSNNNGNRAIQRHPFSSFDLNKYKIKSMSMINSHNDNYHQSTKNTQSPITNMNDKDRDSPKHMRHLSNPVESRNIQNLKGNLTNQNSNQLGNLQTFSNDIIPKPSTGTINPTLMNMIMAPYTATQSTNNDKNKTNNFNDILVKFISEQKKIEKPQPFNNNISMMIMPTTSNQLFKPKKIQTIIKPNYFYKHKALHDQSSRRMLIEYVKLNKEFNNKTESIDSTLSQMMISNQILEQERIHPRQPNSHRYSPRAFLSNNEGNQTKTSGFPSLFVQINNLFEETQDKINLCNFLIIPRVLNLITDENTLIPCTFIVSPSTLSITHGIETYILKYKELQNTSSNHIEGFFDISDIDECSANMMTSFRFTIHVNKEDSDNNAGADEDGASDANLDGSTKEGTRYIIEAPSTEIRNAYVKGLNALMKKLQLLLS